MLRYARIMPCITGLVENLKGCCKVGVGLVKECENDAVDADRHPPHLHGFDLDPSVALQQFYITSTFKGRWFDLLKQTQGPAHIRQRVYTKLIQLLP